MQTPGGFRLGGQPASTTGGLQLGGQLASSTGGFQLGGQPASTTGGLQLGGLSAASGLQLGAGGGGLKVGQPGAQMTTATGGLQLGGLGGGSGLQLGAGSKGPQLGQPVPQTATATVGLGGGGGLQLGAGGGGLKVGQLGTQMTAATGGLQLGGLGGGGGLQLGTGGKGPQLGQPLTQTTTAPGGLQLGGGGGLQLKPQATGGLQPTNGGLKLGAPAGGQSGGLKLPAYNAAIGVVGSQSSTTGAGTQPTAGFQLGNPAGTRPGQLPGSGLGGLKPTTVAQQQLKPGSLGTPSLGMKQPTGLKLTASTTAPGLPGPITGAGPKTSLTTTAPSGSAPSKKYTYKELEELVNKWSLELQGQERVFLQQAVQVNKWDRVLAENGDKVVELNNEVDRVKNEQKRVDNELDWIQTQQGELDNLLTQLESKIDHAPSHGGLHADMQRTRTFQMSENIDSQLKQMAQDLKKIIEQMNETNSPPDEDNPFTQIVKILNAHTDSLGWIDHEAALLRKKVDDVAKVTDYRRQEQEMSFRKAFNPY